MTSEEFDKFNASLIAENPLFDRHIPEGWKDFRGMTWPNKDWRMGMYKYHESNHFKVIVGDPETAASCVETLKARGIQAAVERQTETDGWWQVMFQTEAA